jgi:hypothetical protein
MSKIGVTNPFQAYYDSLPDPQVDLGFTSSQLALFYYPEPSSPNPNFITNRIMPSQKNERMAENKMCDACSRCITH